MGTKERGIKEDIRCPCGATEVNNKYQEDWIECDICKKWQHTDCIGVTKDPKSL
jgi:hypothetical protein